MIRVGIGGWNFAPWRGLFYPKGLPQTQELKYASERLTSIEINSTFYGSASPKSFQKWAAETPDTFQFSVKAARTAAWQSDLRVAGDAIDRFVNAGLDQLGPKLGPIFWQIGLAKKFNAEEIGAFFKLLPTKLGKLPLRHAIEVRSPTFATPAFYDLCRKHNVAIILVDSQKHHQIAEPTADFAYARLQGAVADEETGYSVAEIKKWAKRAKDASQDGKRDVFFYFISAAKERNPAAAMKMIELLK
jgi:uncharacterized protein YecE (DUF72 family)